MAKGAYSVVAYPTSCNLDEVLDRFRGSGASIMWILHDKDIDENGKPIDSHWHVAAGWEKGFPDWKKFLAMRDSINEECFTGDREKFKPSCFGKMTPEKCIVHDAELLEDYFLHRDDKSKAAGKHEYSEDELHKDETWLGSVYNSVELRRTKASKKRAEDKSADFAQALKIAKDHKIGEWADLCDYYLENGLDVGSLVTCAYPIKAYLDSVRNIGKTSAVELQNAKRYCSELLAELEQYRNNESPAVLKMARELHDKVVELNNCQLELQKERAELDRTERALTRAINWVTTLYSENSGEYVFYTDVLNAVYDFKKRPELG